MILRLLARITARWQRRDLDRESADELAFHLQMQTEDNIRRGMTPTDARGAALRSLGGVDQVREAVRDARMTWADSAWCDLRYATRILRRSRGYTTAALLTLAVGIGATTAIVALGVVAGLCGSWALGRVVQGYLFEVAAHDLRVLAGVGLLLGTIALAACWPPARRASLTDPVTVLKAE